MTCIVAYQTKKAFKEAVAADPDKVRIEDPSIFAPFVGTLAEYMEQRPGMAFVTNHPKRSWFANITKRNGRLVVS